MFWVFNKNNPEFLAEFKRLNSKRKRCFLTDSEAEIIWHLTLWNEPSLTPCTCLIGAYIHCKGIVDVIIMDSITQYRLWGTVYIEIKQSTFTFCHSGPSGGVARLQIAAMMRVIPELQRLEVTRCRWKHCSYEIITCQSWYCGLSVVFCCVNTDWQVTLR